MKKFIFAMGAILIVNISMYSQCIPRVFSNELEISIDFDSGNLTVTGLDCDICELGIIGHRACECRSDCESDKQECFDECKDNFSGLTDLANCIENCRNRASRCLDGCGEVPIPERVAIDFDIQVNIWYNTGLTETFDGQPNVIAGTPVIIGNPPNSVNVNLNHNFPEEPISYCFVTQTTIFYNDGTCCVYFDFACFNLG